MTWWVWIVAGLALALLEIVVPAWIFLGFAIGAVGMGLVLLAGGPLAMLVEGSLAWTLLVYALLSVAAWATLRRALGVRKGQVRVWQRDINED